MFLRHIGFGLSKINHQFNWKNAIYLRLYSETIHTECRKLRNIGIIAHINAGKTTTTERILYHSGLTQSVGDVDKGNTVTDYLVQERDRGITITSAAVTFNWRRHQINLIDTPGHVDFTVEVERSLAVLDGAVTILDASSGVEAQTITVWNQASKYKVPNVVLLNKYDKPQADLEMCMKDLVSNLESKVQVIQLPIKNPNSSQFRQFLDVIERTQISWDEPELDKGSKFCTTKLADLPTLDKRFIHKLEEERENLVNTLTDLDDNFANHVLECHSIAEVCPDQIKRSLRKATLNCQVCPVLVASSFKYVGVQHLMDAIVDYLPSPVEREKQIRREFNIEPIPPKNLKSGDANCAFIFKIARDRRIGSLAYMRVYKGSISKSMKLKNLDTGKQEQMKRLHRVFADELIEIEQPVEEGDIVAASGILEACTGDTLVEMNFSADSEVAIKSKESSLIPFRVLRDDIIVPRINRLEPVYFCSIESRLGSQQLKLEQALACVAREDPSFTYALDEHGITTIRGMGKLHLEIARDRLESEHGIDALLGPLQISYRETIERSATEELSADRLIGTSKSSISLKLLVEPRPGAGPWSDKMLRLDLSPESTLGTLRRDHRKAIGLGVVSAMKQGPARGFPMIDCDVLLLEFKANSRCALPMISSTVSRCLSQALKRCSPVLLEPVMRLEVVAPSESNGLILGDIAFRRGILDSTSARANGTILIRAQVPLSNLGNYSEFLRINTSGRATFSMELLSYRPLGESEWSKIGL